MSYINTVKFKGALRLPFWLISVALAAIAMLFSRTAVSAVCDALLLCVNTVIPALFPFLVINGVLIRSGFARFMGCFLEKPVKFFFGLNGACAAALITGVLCGYPSGAKAAADLYDRGLCTKEEGERMLAFCNNTGPAFLIAGVGGTMLGSIKAGILIYVSQVVSAFIIGVLMKTSAKERNISMTRPPLANLPELSLAVISDSIKDSVIAILNICGSVVFFSATARLVISVANLPDTFRCLICGFLEITQASAYAAKLFPPSQTVICIAAFVGWSGLSVHTQTGEVTGGRFSLKKYYFGKLVSCIFSALLCAAAVKSGIF